MLLLWFHSLHLLLHGSTLFVVAIPCLKIVVLTLHFRYACFVCLMEKKNMYEGYKFFC
jgi:hypothetical protein